MYFLEPFKTRTYALIAGDWVTESFCLEFDDGVFTHVEKEKAIYFFANITKLSPEPTVKYKPEEFVWKTPTQAMFIFHYDEYQINTKESGEWKKKTLQPGVIETEICKFLITQDSYLNVPVSGVLDFANSMMSRSALGKGDEETKTQWIENILAIYTLDKHTEGFSTPDIGKKISGSNYKKTAYTEMSTSEKLKLRKEAILSILANLDHVCEDSDKNIDSKIVDALMTVKMANTSFYPVLIDYLKIVIK